MFKTRFEISKMDCPSEENLIRLSLNEVSGIEHLDFDLSKRILTVYHNNNLEAIEKSILNLNLGGKIISTEEVVSVNFETDENSNQKKILLTVLVINFSFFLIEMIFGWVSKSIGLLADSLDMLADSFVYFISLFAVGGSVIKKKKIAKISGYFQILLACLGFIEVVRRFFYSEKLPDFATMIGISILALFANAICLYILQKSKNKNEAHIKASMIFTSNDVIINLGVIVAGFLVYLFDSKNPDLLIGTLVFALVIQGAFRILKLSK